MKKRLKVCMFSNLFFPVVSGSSTQSMRLSKELVKRGHHVTVITAKIIPNTESYENIDGVDVYRIPAIRIPKMLIFFNFPWLSLTFTPKNLKRVEKIIQNYKPDILHLHNHMFDLGLSAKWIRRKIKLPLVITIHTVLKHSQLFYNVLLGFIDLAILKRLIIDHADTLLCPDLNIRRYVYETFNRKNEPIIPYGISLPSSASQTTIKKLEKKYMTSDKRVILSLGHVHEIRNRMELISAMPAILEQFPETILLIVGAIATDRPGNLVKKLGLQNTVLFTGPVPHEYIPAFLHIADLEAHWLTQESSEITSLGIASLEAMYAGKTILSFANANTYGDDILKNGDNIVILPSGKAECISNVVINLFNDEKKCKEIGKNASQTIKRHFSWDIVCQKTESEYYNVLKRYRL